MLEWRSGSAIDSESIGRGFKSHFQLHKTDKFLLVGFLFILLSVQRSFWKTRLMLSKTRTLSESNITIPSSLRVKGELLNNEPPK